MVASTMRAWQLMPGARSPDDLALVDVARPEPRPGEILVRVRACSLNYRDRLIAEGMYPVEQGFVPLSDGVGEVAAIGAGGSRFRAGDRVAASFLPDWFDGTPLKRAGKALGQPGAPGKLAEYVALPEKG
jgi:NADPH:quinone reductase-like Zn-dependent oxidoreductase